MATESKAGSLQEYMRTRLQAFLTEIEDGHDLSHYAAHAAASELVRNWESHLTCGSNLKDCRRDINDTIGILQQFQNKVAAI